MEGSKVLSAEMITNLLRKEKIATNRTERWPDSEDMLRLAQAVSRKKTDVLFSDGRTFKIRYDDHHRAVFVSPSRHGYVPCGYISYKELEEVLKENDGSNS